MANAIVKIIIGAILVIGSVWWVLQGSIQYLGRSGWGDFVTVVNGAIPVFVFLIGLFVVWLELDELRVEKEITKKKKRRK